MNLKDWKPIETAPTKVDCSYEVLTDKGEFRVRPTGFGDWLIVDGPFIKCRINEDDTMKDMGNMTLHGFAPHYWR